MDDGWPRSRRYVIWSSANWVGFIAAVAFLTWGTARLPDTVVWAIVLVVAGTVGAQFFAAYRLVAEQDEFVRGISAKRGIAAAGVTITVAVLWGLMEQFLGVPQVPMWVVYPFFWGAFGIVTPFIRDSHA
ncbi:MAG TPA: hypothetical protein VEW25_12340 [Allosphingosinicella sp.]|nr:hypothetical protein [Allosphingosinicella sp.]